MSLQAQGWIATRVPYACRRQGRAATSVDTPDDGRRKGGRGPTARASSAAQQAAGQTAAAALLDPFHHHPTLFPSPKMLALTRPSFVRPSQPPVGDLRPRRRRRELTPVASLPTRWLLVAGALPPAEWPPGLAPQGQPPACHGHRGQWRVRPRRHWWRYVRLVAACGAGRWGRGRPAGARVPSPLPTADPPARALLTSKWLWHECLSIIQPARLTRISYLCPSARTGRLRCRRQGVAARLQDDVHRRPWSARRHLPQRRLHPVEGPVRRSL
jgi:hypothetical protein